MREFETLGDFIQRLLLDQIGPHARKIAFVNFGVAIIEQGGDHAVKNRVAQKFQPLIVQRAMTTMRQRQLQQGAILKLVA